jgi:hypothetical protein
VDELPSAQQTGNPDEESAMPEAHLRAGDEDRERVAVALGKHMAAGRLSLAEYEDRLARGYAARTFGELARLTADLPTLPHAAPPSPAPAASVPAPGVPAPMAPWAPHGHQAHSWRAWLTTSVVVLVVYLAVSLGNQEFDYFWPMWVIGPWGAALLASRFAAGTRPRDERADLRRSSGSRRS